MHNTSSLPTKQELLEMLKTRHVGSNSASCADYGLLVAVSIPIEKISILGWLKAVRQHPKSYWCSRDRQFEYGGSGNILTSDQFVNQPFAKRLDMLQELICRSHNAPCPTAFVGGYFDESAEPDEVWRVFPRHVVQIPEICVVREGESYSIRISSISENSAARPETVKAYEQLRSAILSTVEFPEVSIEITSRIDYPNYDTWKDVVSSAMREISCREIEKIVLARRTDLLLANSLDPIELMARLSKLNQECYAMMYMPDNDRAFLSVSPEQLFETDGTSLKTEAVAGTVIRGETGHDDIRLEEKLRKSAKDNSEHKYVAEGICQSLDPLCINLRSSADTSILKLPKVQHLITRIEGKLEPGVTLGRIYTAMHPTAAVCGTPREKSRLRIAQLERFNRGWYAGTQGTVSTKRCELAVGIRSMVLSQKRLSVFTGAGIVSQSDPEQEWQELEDKLQSIISSLVGTPV